MRNGYKIIDTDTHVWPSVEVLKRYADETLLNVWDKELGPYERVIKQPITWGDPNGPWTTLSINPRAYDREIGEKSEGEAEERGAGGKASLEGKIKGLEMTDRSPREGIGHDNSAGRLEDMDREGIDAQVLIPGTWPQSATVLDLDIAKGLYEAYHRYMWDFCSADPERLSSLLILTGRDPEWSVKQIQDNIEQPSLGSAMLTLPEGQPVDDPDLEPIWAAMAEADLPLLHHSFFYEPPYFPGYRDVWDNRIVARTAAHPWGAQRLVAYLCLSGVFDRHPNFRIGFSETGVGWLPQWLLRLDMQSNHLIGRGPALKQKPSEYAQNGHIYCGIELYEGQEVAKFVCDVLGDGVLMYQSDYPHGQCKFPDSPEVPLAYSTLSEDQRKAMFSENAERFLKNAS